MINWILLISTIIGIVGIYAYGLDVIHGKIDRFTLWKELTVDQRIYVAMGLQMPVICISTLLIPALWRLA